MIKDFFIDLLYPPWILFILFWILLFLSIFYYRKSLPPLSPFKLYLFTTLRFIAMVIVCFLLFQPVVNVILERKKLPTLAVLIDNSASMTVQEDYGLRSDSIQYILKNFDAQKYPDSLQIKFFSFGEKLTPYKKDSLNFQETQTNIYQALNSVSDSLENLNFKGIVLISDGRYNQGSYPIQFTQKHKIPVYTVGVGSLSSSKDIWISDIRVKPVNYAGKEFPLQVRIMQNGFSEKEVTLRLYRDDQLIEAKKTTLAQSGFENEVSFSLKSDDVGELRYWVSLDGDEQETNLSNNRTSFLVRILRSKIRALLLSGSPSYDQKILTFCLKKIPDIELTCLTEKSGGDYYEGNFSEIKLDSQDVFICLGFPTSLTREEYLVKILSRINSTKVPVFFFLTQRTDLNKFSGWESILPVNIPDQVVKILEVSAQLTSAGNFHPVTLVESDLQQLKLVWKDLPPVTGLGNSFVLKEGNTILLEYEKSKGIYPLLSAYVFGDYKSLLFTGMNFYSWHFQLQDDIQRQNFFLTFVERALKWLVNNEDIQRIQIQPDKKVYKLGETIRFMGQLYDEFYDEVSDARVTLSLTGKGMNHQDMMLVEGGFYSYEFSNIPPGMYDYHISAEKNNQTLGQITGKLLVEEIELEKQETSADLVLLKELAEESGGQFWSAQQTPDLLSNISFTNDLYFSAIEYNLWNKWYWLVILGLLFSGEWYLRKRWGLL
jgi:hypothetical protein